MLTQEQLDFYNEKGWLHIPQMFTKAEIDQLSDELDRLVQEWAFTTEGWSGSWRKAFMDPETEKKAKLTHLHDLQFYSEPWLRAVTHPRLVEAISDILGPNVELHHSTLHIKPPQTGHPFPMHQDNAFYVHTNGQYCDVLVHLDDTFHENGEIRFLDGSHKWGYLEHVTQNDDGTPCTPHFPFEKYPLEETTPVPAKRGDVVFFHIYTIHGSHINQTKDPRRLVRVGYRDPENYQLTGQSVNRAPLMVKGYRNRNGREPFGTE